MENVEQSSTTDVVPMDGFLINDDPMVQTISDWFIRSSFLNDEQSHELLRNAAEIEMNMLAQAFYTRFYLKKNNFNIPYDLQKAKGCAVAVLPWLNETIQESENDKLLLVACCEYIIGYYYYHNLIPSSDCQSNKQEAVMWMTRSANHYYPPAISNLGVYYDLGDGLDKNMKKAAELYQLAARMNFAPAICNFATCLLKGEGVERDLERAAILFQESFTKGFLPSATNLGYCYDKGQGVLMNKIEAVRLYRLAAERGNQSAQFNMGLCYEKGEGLERNLNEAIKWYRLCAEQGDQHSAAKVTMLQSELVADNCPICLEKANLRGRQILITPGCCGKLFHEKCFHMILVQHSDGVPSNHRNHGPLCPICREPIPTTCLQNISAIDNY